jgi:hypothetical protein
MTSARCVVIQYDSCSLSDRSSRLHLFKCIALLWRSAQSVAHFGNYFGRISLAGSASLHWFPNIGTRQCRYSTVIQLASVQLHSPLIVGCSHPYHAIGPSACGMPRRGPVALRSGGICARSKEWDSHLTAGTSQRYLMTEPSRSGTR